jgi:endonuclease/exonuclease/phosphatase family metal-dependent hydrolase
VELSLARVPITVKLFIVVALAALLGLSQGRAGVLLNEPFSYANGPITNVSAGLWANHSGTDGQVNIMNGEVSLTFSETEDVNVPLGGQPYPAAGATNIFYARFTARFTELPTAGGSWFACFKDGSVSGFRCRVFALADDAAPGKFRIGLSTVNNNSATQTNQTDLSLDAPFTIVMRLANTNSIAALWLNPSSESDASLTTTEATSTFTVAGFALRQNTGMGSLALDDLVVGTSFADVLSPSTPVAPFITTSPTNQMIARGSNVTLIAAATGTAPLRYQWMFNGSPIPTATNTTLSLTNISLAQQGDYAFVVTNVAAAVTSAPAALTITVTATASTNAAFTLLSYNAHGAAIADWSTNSAQVQAIGRQVQFLDPDIITFQEIPLTNNGTAQMANFVTAFRPGYFLATNSGNDGFIRSVILSRFPITRSAKWLDGINLTSFGYNGFFTRDLFEAEIRVPSLPQPLHVFTTHLKSGQDSDDTLRRAAESRAISNFFRINFLPTYPLRPYLLTGDMNEDVADPPATGVALPTLTSTATGLKLATPINPVTESHLTFSIRAASLTRRYDYVLPCALLATNIIGGHVFRTDLATNIAPALTNDCVTASDHLPVFMSFANPYATPFRITTIYTTSNTVMLTWNTVPGGKYGVEASTNLSAWAAIATNLLASNATLSFTTNRLTPLRFYRISSKP